MNYESNSLEDMMRNENMEMEAFNYFDGAVDRLNELNDPSLDELRNYCMSACLALLNSHHRKEVFPLVGDLWAMLHNEPTKLVSPTSYLLLRDCLYVAMVHKQTECSLSFKEKLLFWVLRSLVKS